MARYETTLVRAVLGLVAGAATGGVLIALLLLPGSNLEYLRQYGLGHGIAIFIYAAGVWTMGLGLVAPVPWALLHWRGYRGPWVAVSLGALLSSAVLFGFLTDGFGLFPQHGVSAADSGGPTRIDGRLTLHGWVEAAQLSLLCGVVGGIVGLVIWRTAYRRKQAADPAIHHSPTAG